MMKKNIINSFMMMFAMVLFVACGSDSKENPPEPESPYTFFNVTTPIIITQSSGGSSCSSGTCNGKTSSCSSGTCSDKTLDTNSTSTPGTSISLQLLKYGLVEAGEMIEMKPFNHKYGFVTNSFVTTDLNGKATFIYNAPEDFNAIRGQNITIQAIYAEQSNSTSDSSSNTDRSKDILLTQDIVLQFR